MGGEREGVLQGPGHTSPLSRAPCSKGTKKSFSSVLSSCGFHMWCSLCPTTRHRAMGVRADPRALPLTSGQSVPLGPGRVEGRRVTGQGRGVSSPEPIHASPVWLWR